MDIKKKKKDILPKEQRIFEAAILEFSQKGYELSSMSSISARAEVSKGLLYHYYKNKKELYLSCIRGIGEEYMKIFDMQAILKLNLIEAFHYVEKLKMDFFGQNKVFINLFLNSFYMAPQDIQEDLQKEFAPMMSFSVTLITKLLEKENLRPGISLDMAVKILLQASSAFMKDIVQGFLENDEDLDFQRISQEYYEFLDILLYGALEKTSQVDV